MKYAKEIGFLAKFSLIFAAGELLLLKVGAAPLQEFIASTQASIFGLESLGNLIVLRGGALEIVPSCTGLVSGTILAAIIFSLRKPEMKEKIITFLAGLAVLLALNYLRLIFVVWVAKDFGLAEAEFAHVVSWFATTAFVIGVWYFATKRVAGVKSFSGFL